MEDKETEPQKINVLEIGSGSHTFDRPNEKRTYLDIKFEIARRYKGRGTADRVEADATKTLPFPDKAFDKVEIFLPSGSLIKSLIDESQEIWSEVPRVMKENGQFEVVVENSQDLIKKAAENRGLNVEVAALNSKELEKIGTNSALLALMALERKEIGGVYKLLITRK